MTNEEYYQELNQRLTNLQNLLEEGKSISTSIIGESLFKEDLFFCASVNRCLNLIDGFTLMLKSRNLTCAGALLRLQMDNCMRTYAAFIAKDKNAVIDCILDGQAIKNQKSTECKQMNDGYLKEKLTELDPLFSRVYNNASGYIHLSEKAFYQTIVQCKDNTIQFYVGLELPEKFNPLLLEAVDAIIHFVKLHYKLLYAVTDSKMRLDTSHSGNLT